MTRTRAYGGIAQFLVVAPSTSDNSLGRALCLAAVLQHLGPVATAAAEHGSAWPGVASWDFTVARYSSPRELLRIAERRLRAYDLPLVVIAVKPLPTSLGAALLIRAVLRHRHRSVWLIADLDEDDVALRTAALRSVPRRQRLRRHAAALRDVHVGHPLLVRLLQTGGVPRADAVSVSSWELARALVHQRRSPVVRIPHAREIRDYAPPSDSDRLRLGFLGTPRGYKGIRVLGALLDALPDVELHLLGDRAPDALLAYARASDRVKLHHAGARASLVQAFSEVDVVVLPQDPAAEQTKLQLPAKLVDALMFGRPVVATATPPILELGGAYVSAVASWSPLDEAVATLAALRDPDRRERLGRAANEYARRSLSTMSVAQSVAELVGSLVQGRR